MLLLGPASDSRFALVRLVGFADIVGLALALLGLVGAAAVCRGF